MQFQCELEASIVRAFSLANTPILAVKFLLGSFYFPILTLRVKLAEILLF